MTHWLNVGWSFFHGGDLRRDEDVEDFLPTFVLDRTFRVDERAAEVEAFEDIEFLPRMSSYGAARPNRLHDPLGVHDGLKYVRT